MRRRFAALLGKLKRLQCIQNSAARLVVHASKFDHVTPVLIKLHWLPVRFRIMFKILLMVYKCLHDMAPPYLANVIKPRKGTGADCHGGQ